MQRALIIGTSLGLLSLTACSPTEKISEASNKAIEKAQSAPTTKTAGFNANKNAYFGDLHIHTKNSFDAYIFNVRTTPDDVYRFAKGESVRHPSGFDITIAGDPLDFVAATDNGASVDLTDCSISSDVGAPELKTLWQDPDFNPKISASYYVRVLENPSCRWSTWDALKAGVERHPDLQPTLQERAYTSPI